MNVRRLHESLGEILVHGTNPESKVLCWDPETERMQEVTGYDYDDETLEFSCDSDEEEVETPKEYEALGWKLTTKGDRMVGHCGHVHRTVKAADACAKRLNTNESLGQAIVWVTWEISYYQYRSKVG